MMTLDELQKLPYGKQIPIKWDTSGIIEILYRRHGKGNNAFTVTNVITRHRYRLPVWLKKEHFFSLYTEEMVTLGDLLPKHLRK